MRLQQNRYLWIQVVGLATVPLLLDVCLVGLASSGLAVPFGFQFWAIALLGIVPTLWMQLAKPFYVFSLPPVALNPTVLSDQQRRCLTLLKSWQVKALAGLTACFSLWVLLQVYAASSQVMPLMTPGVGLASAAAAFLLSCAFLQVAVSAVRALLVGPEALERVAPYETGAIATDFLVLGLRVKRILPVPVEANHDPPPLADDALVEKTLAQEAADENLSREEVESKSSGDQDFDDSSANEEVEAIEFSEDDSLANEEVEVVLSDEADGLANEELEETAPDTGNSDDDANQPDLETKSENS